MTLHITAKSKIYQISKLSLPSPVNFWKMSPPPLPTNYALARFSGVLIKKVALSSHKLDKSLSEFPKFEKEYLPRFFHNHSSRGQVSPSLTGKMFLPSYQ